MSGWEKMRSAASKQALITLANSRDTYVNNWHCDVFELDERDKLADKYNSRIVEFLEQAANEPE